MVDGEDKQRLMPLHPAMNGIKHPKLQSKKVAGAEEVHKVPLLPNKLQTRGQQRPMKTPQQRQATPGELQNSPSLKHKQHKLTNGQPLLM